MRSTYPSDPWTSMFDPSLILKSSTSLVNPKHRSSSTNTTIKVVGAADWPEVVNEEEDAPRGRRRDSKELPHLSSSPSSPSIERRASLSQSPPSSSLVTPPNGFSNRPPSPSWYHRSQPLGKLPPIGLSAPAFEAHHSLPPIPVVTATSSSSTKDFRADLPCDPILYLPPLLSRLPAWVEPHKHSNPKLAPAEQLANFDTRLPDIDPASLALHQALHFFQPRDDNYASRKYNEAFNWSHLHLPISISREWYCVVFRSRRTLSSSSLSLYAADREAHEEAVARGGLVMYWYGVPDETGLNLATCIWQSRKHAIKAISGPKHLEAMKQAKDAYEVYELERWVLSKEKGVSGLKLSRWERGDVGW